MFYVMPVFICVVILDNYFDWETKITQLPVIQIRHSGPHYCLPRLTPPISFVFHILNLFTSPFGWIKLPRRYSYPRSSPVEATVTFASFAVRTSDSTIKHPTFSRSPERQLLFFCIVLGFSDVSIGWHPQKPNVCNAFVIGKRITSHSSKLR